MGLAPGLMMSYLIADRHGGLAFPRVDPHFRAVTGGQPGTKVPVWADFTLVGTSGRVIRPTVFRI
jgi:hypothetical protein